MILVADDLSASSMGAVRKAMNLAVQWGHTHVIHLHVIEESMHSMLTELAAISRKVHVKPMGTPELLEYLEKEMQMVLERRTSQYQGVLKQNASTYEAVVQVGHVTSQVSVP